MHPQFHFGFKWDYVLQYMEKDFNSSLHSGVQLIWMAEKIRQKQQFDKS